MVHFTPSPRQPGDEHLAPITYLPGTAPSTGSSVGGDTHCDASDDAQSGRRGDHERASAPPRTATRAANVSLHQLARRGMSRWELAQVLEKRGVESPMATAELDRLESVGLLDDAALAVTLVYTQHTRRGLGRAAIAQELKRRHIDAEIIADAVSEIADDDEQERATELAHKRVSQLASVDDEIAERRLSGFLARKGYSSAVVRHAVASALATRQHGVRFR